MDIGRGYPPEKDFLFQRAEQFTVRTSRELHFLPGFPRDCGQGFGGCTLLVGIRLVGLEGATWPLDGTALRSLEHTRISGNASFWSGFMRNIAPRGLQRCSGTTAYREGTRPRPPKGSMDVGSGYPPENLFLFQRPEQFAGRPGE